VSWGVDKKEQSGDTCVIGKEFVRNNQNEEAWSSEKNEEAWASENWAWWLIYH